MSSLILETGTAALSERSLRQEEADSERDGGTPNTGVGEAGDDDDINKKGEGGGGQLDGGTEDEETEANPTHLSSSPAHLSSSAAHLSSYGLEIVFRDVYVSLSGQSVLKEVSGMACPGEVLAIMGPSGGGKTTLLNTLAGRQAVTQGEITLNGVILNKTLKRKISYVLQDDIFFSNLTLRETLMFTTMLRLPDSMSHDDKVSRMEEVIDTLDIRKCLDTKIGDTWCRGLSGGEKKRASVACELITDPNILFLDEPTSGLDYSTSLSLVSTLKNVASQFHKTVVMTIHQPASKIFFQFDKLLLMSEGQVAYYGKCRDVIPFFASLDLAIDPFINPADFIVDKLKEGPDIRKKIVEGAKLLQSKQSWLSSRKSQLTEAYTNPVTQDGDGLSDRRRKVKSATRLKKSLAHDGTDNGSVHVSLMELDDQTDWVDDGPKWPTGFVTQYVQLTLRTFRQSRSRILDKLKIAESIVLCLLVSLIWFQLPRSEDTLRDRMGALFFICIHWGFTPLFDAVSSFPLERVVIHKERSSGWYRLSAYYLAKMTSELPLILIQPTIFVTVAYWCIGLHGAGPYFLTVLVVMVNSIAGQSIGLFVGILCMDFRRAMVVATIVMMAIMLLGGFYTRTLPVWLDWIKYVSFLHYSFHSVLVLEFDGADPIKCADKRNSSNFPVCSISNSSHIPTDQILDFYDIDWSFASYFLPLLLFIFILRTASYLLLRFFHRPVSV